MESHLLQMRGLKHQNSPKKLRHLQSHLLQMRGLKRKFPVPNLPAFRRIFYRCVD